MLSLCPSGRGLVRVVPVDPLLPDLWGGVGDPLQGLQLSRAQGGGRRLPRGTGGPQRGGGPGPEAALPGDLLLPR